MNEEENWLHGEQIECPSCHQLLYRVDHSPFYDEHFLYCNRCPIHVEVSYYDPVYKRVYKYVRQAHSQLQGDEYIVLMRSIEERLGHVSAAEDSSTWQCSRRVFYCEGGVYAHGIVVTRQEEPVFLTLAHRYGVLR